MQNVMSVLMELKDGTDALPLLFNMQQMPMWSIQQMSTLCNQTMEEMRVEIEVNHGVMQFCQDWLALFDATPEVKEQLLETWDHSVARRASE